jgi:hypothetical protein
MLSLISDILINLNSGSPLRILKDGASLWIWFLNTDNAKRYRTQSTTLMKRRGSGRRKILKRCHSTFTLSLIMHIIMLKRLLCIIKRTIHNWKTLLIRIGFFGIMRKEKNRQHSDQLRLEWTRLRWMRISLKNSRNRTDRGSRTTRR